MRIVTLPIESGRRAVAELKRPSIEELEQLVRAWLPNYLSRTDPRGRQVDRKRFAQSLELEIEHLDACLFTGVRALSGEWLAEHFVQEHQLALSPSDPLWSDLVLLSMRAKLEGARRELDRLSSRTGHIHDGELFARDRYEEDQRRLSRTDVTIGDAADQFLSEKAPSLKGKTMTLYRARVQIVTDALGRERALKSVTRDDCRRVRDDVILKLPAHFRRRFPNATAQAAIAEADREGLPRYSRATQSLFVEVMATFFRWAIDQELIDRDPAKGLRLSRGGDEERRAFGTPQLAKLFSAPTFIGAANSGRLWRRTGPELISDHRYWVPLIALYSGMRLNEICQLLVADVVEIGGVAAFDIRPSKRAGKSVKTKAGHRQVPLHPALFDLGFAEYLAGRRAASDSPLQNTALETATHTATQSLCADL